MPTRAQVEGWRTSALSDWAAKIEAGEQKYTAQIDRARDHFRNLDGEWSGAAHDAAYDRVSEDHDEGRKLAFEIREFVLALRNADTRLADERRILLGKVADAENDHPHGANFTISDVWAITAEYPETATAEERGVITGRAFGHQDAITAAYNSFNNAITEVVNSINTNNTEVRARGDQLAQAIFVDGPAGWTSQRDLTGALGREDGENLSDGKLSDDEAARIAARLSQANLTPEQLEALANGGEATVPASTMEYLTNLYDKAGRDGLLTISEQLKSNGSPESQQLRQGLANGLMTVSNQDVVVKDKVGKTVDRGAWEKLHPEVRELIGTRPEAIPGLPDSNTRELPDDYRGGLFQSDDVGRYSRDMSSFADLVNSAGEGYEPGERFGVELSRQAAHQVSLADAAIAGGGEDRLPGLADDATIQDLLGAGTRSNEANYALITGNGSDELFGKGTPGQSFDGFDRDNFLSTIVKHEWEDNGAAAGNLFRWIETDATSSDGQVSVRAGEAATAVSDHLVKNYDTLMNLHGARTESIGVVNPELVQGFSSALKPYIPELAGLPDNPQTLSNGFTAPDPYTDSARSNAQKLFALIDTDKDAAAEFNAQALIAAQELQGEWVKSVLADPENPKAEFASTAGVIQGLVDAGLIKESTDRTGDTAGDMTRALADKSAAYDSVKALVSSGVKYIPVVGSVAGPVIDMGNPWAKNAIVGLYYPPDPASPNFDAHTTYEPAARNYQIAHIIQSTQGSLPHDPRYDELFDANGQLKEYTTLVDGQRINEKSLDSYLTNILNGYQGGILTNHLQDLDDRLEAGRESVR
ncbi:hypothetical protein [Nocardia cyriacigeorgica]|uniref:TPR repeat region-containing protein n=2 Tax=Nocardia cyriacigeorgica TaxID=135487 RepID=UPI001107F2D0|nr:hypothetical protein [Nocardia cyriacigeorgica]TLF60642.1 hypothetical protein FEK31_02675 [Nocardia cyriacigeorgica]